MKSAIVQATLTDSQALRFKICDSHLTCKVANKCLIVRERVKENPDRKKK